MPGERPQVCQIAGENGPARLGNCCDKCIDRGLCASPDTQPGRPAGERNGNTVSDIAGAQESVFLNSVAVRAGVDSQLRRGRRQSRRRLAPPSLPTASATFGDLYRLRSAAGQGLANLYHKL